MNENHNANNQPSNALKLLGGPLATVQEEDNDDDLERAVSMQNTVQNVTFQTSPIDTTQIRAQ